jgi:hypothetical protein
MGIIVGSVNKYLNQRGEKNLEALFGNAIELWAASILIIVN